MEITYVSSLIYGDAYFIYVYALLTLLACLSHRVGVCSYVIYNTTTNVVCLRGLCYCYFIETRRSRHARSVLFPSLGQIQQPLTRALVFNRTTNIPTHNSLSFIFPSLLRTLHKQIHCFNCHLLQNRWSTRTRMNTG